MRRSPHGYTCGLRRHHRVGILLRFVLAEGRSPGTWPTHDAIVNCAELTRPGAEGRRCRTKMLTGCAGPCPLLSSSVTRSQITSRSRASGRDRMKLRRARCAVPFYRITTQTSDGFVDEGVLYRRHKALGRRRCQPPGWSAGIDLYHAHQGLRAWIRSMCIEIVMGVGGGVRGLRKRRGMNTNRQILCLAVEHFGGVHPVSNGFLLALCLCCISCKRQKSSCEFLTVIRACDVCNNL